jgi:hypothetical protein
MFIMVGHCQSVMLSFPDADAEDDKGTRVIWPPAYALLRWKGGACR